jgi:hypothetical protein
VLVEAQVGIESCHPDVDEGLAQPIVRVDFAEASLVPHLIRQLDDVDVMVMSLAGQYGVSRATIGGLRAA